MGRAPLARPAKLPFVQGAANDPSEPLMPVNSGTSFSASPLPSGNIPQNFNYLASVRCQGVPGAASRTFDKTIFLKFAQRSDKHPSVRHGETTLQSWYITLSFRKHHKDRCFPLSSNGLHTNRKITPFLQVRTISLLCRSGRTKPSVKIVRLVHGTLGLNTDLP